MGNAVSFQFSCDQTLNKIGRLLCGKGYIRNLKKNLRALEREMEDLIAIQHDLQNKVAREEKQKRRRLESVQIWLTRVECIDTEVKYLLNATHDQLHNLCHCGLCSENVRTTYIYRKRVLLLLEEAKKLKLERHFEVLTESASRHNQRPSKLKPSHEIMLEKAWDRIMKDEVGIMGLHGMGGVGKTTILNKLHNKFTKVDDIFDVVILVVVSQGAEVSNIQENIARKLNLCGERSKNKTESEKATDMHKVLKGKRFVLMLDDLWEKVDLETIGVPFPTPENKCKVVFTTRNQEVCGRMGDHKPMQLNCLEWHEAWKLFRKKIGKNTLRRNLVIEDLAKMVAEKCRGLPLALSVIGETMAFTTTVQGWKHALDVLMGSVAEFPDMENKIFSVLKSSYDSLVDERTKSCFLYCALFPEDYEIKKEKLIDYWICEGFLGECQVIKRAKNQGDEVLGTLIRANLLTDGICVVRIHNVVREMALWIASDFGKQKENFVVQAQASFGEITKVNDWGVVRRMSMMKTKIKEIACSSPCPELTTLFLTDTYLKNLSGEFIQSMKKLVVLDLSHNYRFDKLPEQISEMACLQYLDLSHTKIEELPIGFHELNMLTQLDLSGTTRLCSIKGISKLSSLRILKLLYSKCHGDVSLVKELQLLENLQFLSITISTELALEIISCDQRLANSISYLRVVEFGEKPVNISLLVRMENLRKLWVAYCHVFENSTNMKRGEIKADTSNIHNQTMIPCFNNLSNVYIDNCNSTKDLTWLLFAPNLVSLDIKRSEDIEEIINKEKATNLTCITPFQKLESLSLSVLPKLESIYWSPLTFPFLKHLGALGCPKLTKLPLDDTSVPLIEEFSIAMDHLERFDWVDFEWDENTKHLFLPHLISEKHF